MNYQTVNFEVASQSIGTDLIGYQETTIGYIPFLSLLILKASHDHPTTCPRRGALISNDEYVLKTLSVLNCNGMIFTEQFHSLSSSKRSRV